ncbi:hypothetical protein TNIN_254121 [Trichonephila inaurata madagascariensis]|uniref:Uncharacterized protein n=1 Tax=Trichonephila inaurata madagascariensis TaxID=2747483 RepID=A0A8X6I2U8_9ARAC|nr:hypothetical protein TNIN_254121 [Trichonephila inaurata madagascariensis]
MRGGVNLSLANNSPIKTLLLKTDHSQNESSFKILADKSTSVRCRLRETSHADCIVARVRHSVKVMVWFVISFKRVERLHIVQGIMMRNQYSEVL